MPLVGVNKPFFLCTHGKQADSPVIAGSGENRAIGREGQAMYGIRMTAEGLPFCQGPVRSDLPELGGVVETCRG